MCYISAMKFKAFLYHRCCGIKALSVNLDSSAYVTEIQMLFELTLYPN